MKKLLNILLPITTLTATLIPLTSCGGKGGEETGDTKVITTDTTLTSGNFKSTSKDQNAVLANGQCTANLSNLTINKTGDCSDTEASSFRGTNSALLAKGGTTTVLDNLTVNTDATGANGVFAYGGNESTKEGETGDGTNITIKNSTINTSKDNSGGIMVAGHGILSATDCKVTTQGNSSAPIRSDRGGNEMTISGGEYTSNGVGSPAIYSTATIKATNSKLKSNHSEGVIIEGKNHVVLMSCELEDTNDKLNGQSTTYKNIFLYQSMSGDAGTGSSIFESSASTIKTHKGDTFYVTNQTATINLLSTTISNDSSGEHYLLRAQKDAWGDTGKNGGKVTLSTAHQELAGDIYIDAISTLNLQLTTGSNWTGALIDKHITPATAATAVVVEIDNGSSWTLTDDSYVGSMADAASLERVNVGTHTLYGWDTDNNTWKVLKQPE